MTVTLGESSDSVLGADICHTIFHPMHNLKDYSPPNKPTLRRGRKAWWEEGAPRYFSHQVCSSHCIVQGVGCMIVKVVRCL